MKIPTRVALLALAGSATLLVTGCSSDPNNVGYGDIVGNLSPELAGLTERPVDRHRHWRYGVHFDRRMLSDDIMRSLHLDHPSRLTPYPLASLTGTPR